MSILSELSTRPHAPSSTPRLLRRRPRSASARRQERAALFFLLPWVVGLVGLTAGPMAASLYLSFTNFTLTGRADWIGFDNYVTMFTADPRYWQSVSVTLTYVAVSVPLVLLFSLVLAIILNTGMKLLPLYRALFYLPSLLGSSVGISLLWRQVFGTEGLVNRVLSIFGIDGPSWLGDPETTIFTLISLHVWAFGSAMIIFLAGLRQVPADLYEAASLDGANAWQRFYKVTLPLLTPVILFNTVLNVINSFQAFTPAYVISGGKGGPVDSTLFYTLYLYQQGFTSFRMGYASAMAWVLLIAIALVTGIIMLTSRRWVFYSDEK